MYPTLRKYYIFKRTYPTFDELNKELDEVTETLAKSEAKFGGRAFAVFKI